MALKVFLYNYFINIFYLLSIIAKKSTTSVQRSKFTQVKERMAVVEQFEEGEDQTSTDDDELITPVDIPIHFSYSIFNNLIIEFSFKKTR
jgi:hypothetical protein